MKYPGFRIQKETFTAVINPNYALVVSCPNYNGGFEFNTYKSRPKVLKLEKNLDLNVTAEQFFNAVNEFMKGKLVTVFSALAAADPSLMSNNMLKLK